MVSLRNYKKISDLNREKSFTEQAKEVREFIGHHAVIGHKFADSDKPWLDISLTRAKLAVSHPYVIDTLLLFKQIMPNVDGALNNACDKLGLDTAYANQDKVHFSDQDAIMSFELLELISGAVMPGSWLPTRNNRYNDSFYDHGLSNEQQLEINHIYRNYYNLLEVDFKQLLHELKQCYQNKESNPRCFTTEQLAILELAISRPTKADTDLKLEDFDFEFSTGEWETIVGAIRLNYQIKSRQLEGKLIDGRLLLKQIEANLDAELDLIYQSFATQNKTHQEQYFASLAAFHAENHVNEGCEDDLTPDQDPNYNYFKAAEARSRHIVAGVDEEELDEAFGFDHNDDYTEEQYHNDILGDAVDEQENGLQAEFVRAQRAARLDRQCYAAFSGLSNGFKEFGLRSPIGSDTSVLKIEENHSQTNNNKNIFSNQ